MKEGWRAVGGGRGERKRGGWGEVGVVWLSSHSICTSHFFFQHNFLHSSMNIANLRYPTKLCTIIQTTPTRGQLIDMMDP